MAATNDITGDKIQSKFSGNFTKGWDAIWGKPKPQESSLNANEVMGRLRDLISEAFYYDKSTDEFLGSEGKCPPPAEIYVWVDGRGACRIKDLYFDPTLGIMIDLK